MSSAEGILPTGAIGFGRPPHSPRFYGTRGEWQHGKLRHRRWDEIRSDDG